MIGFLSLFQNTNVDSNCYYTDPKYSIEKENNIICYCAKNYHWMDLIQDYIANSSSEKFKKCQDYGFRMVVAFVLCFSSAIAIQIMNFVFNIIVAALSNLQRFKTVNQKIIFSIIVTFIFTTINTGIILLILNANWNMISNKNNFCIPSQILYLIPSLSSILSGNITNTNSNDTKE